MIKILISLLLFFVQFQTALSQFSIEDEVSILSKIDSVKNSINESKLIRSPIFGVVEPFAEISGFAFLNLEGTEIKKLELEVLATHEAVTYYCYNNTIHFITTPQAISKAITNILSFMR